MPDGAPVAVRGSAPDGPGFWFPPTVLAPVDAGDRAVREEIFGPVACVIPFRDEAEAIALANDTIYGLSGSIWTRDGARALRVARAIEAGVLSINSNTSVRVSTPFGGFKQSGVGRELGPHALDHYTEVKSVYYATGAELGSAGGEGLRRHGRGERHRRGDRAAVHATRARPSSASTCATTASARSSLAVDVADEQQVSDLYDRVRSEFGRIDVLFNNAGISPTDDASVLETSLEAWQRVQDVNLKSVFLCCKHGIPHLIEGGGGSVINTASFVATMGSATSQISYTASKGGVLALSRELGVEFARQGVRVNALCPGPVNTPLLQELFAKDPVAAARRLVHVPDRALRRGARDRQRGAVPRERRVELRQRHEFMVDGGISQAYTTPE